MPSNDQWSAKSRYPKRTSHFAHKLTRLLFKSCAAQDIGRDACLLVVHIAHTEDAARYCGPVRFWNSQLVETMGFSGNKKLGEARDKAVAAGWLHYERQSNRKVGFYWTMIPDTLTELSDAPIETPIVSIGNGSQNSSRTSVERITDRVKKDSVTNSALTSIPTPESLPPPPSNHWLVVVDALTKCGVGKIDNVIQAAHCNGLSPKDVLDIIQFVDGKPGAYGGGAIHDRVVNARPGQRFDDPSLWPPESDEYQREQRKTFEAGERSKLASQTEQLNWKVESERLEREQLEREYGPTLDSMNESDRNEFAHQHLGGLLLERFRRNPAKATTARQVLLEALRSRESAA